ncbi:hypothetical protein G6F56_007650 [Rhizopus delemar]|nr:hypothetical protein G6F56_007650 [Rhizopus delemar]
MLNKTKHPQRNHGSLPSLNTTLPTRTESYTPTEPDSALFFEKSKTNFTQASQVILFSADTLRRAVQRCIQQTQNENLQSSFAPTLQKLKSTSERLGQQLESSLAIHSSLVQTIACLKELCFQIGTRLSILVQGLDPKTSRHLLTSLYSATVDTKEAWELICPCLTIDPVYTLHRNNNRSNPVLKSPLTGDNSQLYTFMKNAVAGSFHVLSTLRRSIQESLVSLTLPSLERFGETGIK